MAINNEEKLHGAAVLRLVEQLSEFNDEVSLSVKNLESRNFYLLTAERSRFIGRSQTITFGLVIKTSNKRRSPWRYTYTKQNQDELKKIKTKFGEVFSVYAAGEDGFACLNFSDLKEILDEKHEEKEWVSVSRRLRQEYRVSGNDGKREKTLAQNNYPKIIIDYIAKKLGI